MTTGDDRSRDRRGILDQIGSKSRLLPLPQSLVVLRDLTRDPVMEVGKLVPVVERDPALTARLLRLCNSAKLGLPRQVGSVREALVIVGNMPFLRLATSLGLATVFVSRLQAYRLEKEALWHHSLAVAHAASDLVRALGHAQLDGRAFPCGLLHDVGMVLLDGTLAEQGVCMPPEAEADRIRELEREAVGVDRDEAAAELMEQWSLPPMIVEALRWHHEPDRVPDNPLALAVHAADRVVRSLGLGGDGVAAEPLEPLIRRGVPEPVLARLRDRLPELTENLAAMIA